MRIIPNNEHVRSHRTGVIRPINKDDVIKILGFPPNSDGDSEKTTMEWTFKVGGEDFVIWDYKGSYKYDKQFSTFGNSDVLSQLFGDAYKAE